MRLGSRPRMVTIRSFRLAPPPIRFFDLLPTELLRHILHQIDSLPARSQLERQTTLYALCLTSKILHEIAQPLLLERIYSSYIGGKGNLAALVAHSSTQSLATVKTLQLWVHSAFAVFLRDFEKFVRKATRLQEVFIHGEGGAVPILGGTNITTLSLDDVYLCRVAGHISFPELVTLSLYDYGHLEVTQLSVPKLKHLALDLSSERKGSLWHGEVLLLNQVAPTLASLTIGINSSSSLPPSICSSSTSLLFRTSLMKNVPSTLSRSGSVQITLPHAKINYVESEYAFARANLQKWTNLISTSDYQLQGLYLAIYSEGGGGDKVHSGIKEAVNGLVVACQHQGISIFWEEAKSRLETFADGCTFADRVPASFIKRSEARFAEARRM